MTDPPADLSLARTAAGLVFWIHVTPRARRPGVGGTHGGALRVSVGAAPERGEANAVCRRLLAEALGLTAGAVELEAGRRGRRKRVRVEGPPEELAEKLAALARRPSGA